MAHPEGFEEWFDLAELEGLPPEERRARWQTLYAQCRAGDAWQVDGDDAWIATSVGIRLAAEDGDWTLVRDLCDRYLGHLGLDVREHTVQIADVFVQSQLAEAHLGDPAGAVARLLDPERRRAFPRAIYIHDLRNALYDLVQAAPPESALTEPLRRLTTAVFEGGPHAAAASEGETAGEIEALLAETKRSEPSPPGRGR
ncbi:hypothetical protein EON81_07115 [bacterium]|nr:MAG: hypothetical protein EON81_07115 [bacterium]